MVQLSSCCTFEMLIRKKIDLGRAAQLGEKKETNGKS
jgi:hypothetical protein